MKNLEINLFSPSDRQGNILFLPFSFSFPRMVQGLDLECHKNLAEDSILP